MSTPTAIVVVVKDPALLRSITFALVAHGQTVEQFNDWASAVGAALQADCVILDTCLPQADLRAGLSLAQRRVSLVVLAEDNTDYGSETGVHVLSKPLNGSDVADAVAALRRNP